VRKAVHGECRASTPATIGTLELVDEVRRRLLDTHYPARGALEPWDSIAELPVDVRN
jgi:hypothetical protein